MLKNAGDWKSDGGLCQLLTKRLPIIADVMPLFNPSRTLRRNSSLDYKATRSSSIEKYQWQKDGWEPFLGIAVEQNGGVTRITGSLRGHERTWTLYILGVHPSLGKYPVLIKAIDHEKGKYRIATFKFSKEKGFQKIDCYADWLESWNEKHSLSFRNKLCFR